MTWKQAFPIPVHSACSFTWAGCAGIGFTSDMDTQVAARCWPDSYDVGFYVRSPVTGRKKFFVNHTLKKDVEGNVVSSTFKSYDGFTIVVISSDKERKEDR